jgi:hypothetical protein
MFTAARPRLCRRAAAWGDALRRHSPSPQLLLLLALAAALPRAAVAARASPFSNSSKDTVLHIAHINGELRPVMLSPVRRRQQAASLGSRVPFHFICKGHQSQV